MEIIRNLFKEKIAHPTLTFFEKEASGSLLLLLATVVALTWMNFLEADSYSHFWHKSISISIGHETSVKTLAHWINDGLMVFFFFLVGLEIKREILVGELSSPRQAFLPIIAAIGGMVVPALSYLIFNYGTDTASGWGIPMATDIAFAFGMLMLFGDKVPKGLRVFLSTFAIADDIGAIIVIAIFYTQQITGFYLLLCVFFLAIMALANLLWIRWLPFYIFMAAGVWFSIMGSGVHPTLAGVLAAAFVPARSKIDTDLFLKNMQKHLNDFECAEDSCGYSILMNKQHLESVRLLEMNCHDVETPLQRFEQGLQPWVIFLVLPLFALANAGVQLVNMDFVKIFTHPVTLGILSGLLIGKPLGIVLFTYIGVKCKLAELPQGVTWSHIISVSMIGGIGFTMSLFISKLSFTSQTLHEYSKIGILFGSLSAALLGGVFTFLIVREKTLDKK